MTCVASFHLYTVNIFFFLFFCLFSRTVDILCVQLQISTIPDTVFYIVSFRKNIEFLSFFFLSKHCIPCTEEHDLHVLNYLKSFKHKTLFKLFNIFMVNQACQYFFIYFLFFLKIIAGCLKVLLVQSSLLLLLSIKTATQKHSIKRRLWVRPS